MPLSFDHASSQKASRLGGRVDRLMQYAEGVKRRFAFGKAPARSLTWDGGKHVSLNTVLSASIRRPWRIIIGLVSSILGVAGGELPSRR
jgi:hypothetical protein